MMSDDEFLISDEGFMLAAYNSADRGATSRMRTCLHCKHRFVWRVCLHPLQSQQRGASSGKPAEQLESLLRITETCWGDKFAKPQEQDAEDFIQHVINSLPHLRRKFERMEVEVVNTCSEFSNRLEREFSNPIHLIICIIIDIIDYSSDLF